MIRIENKKTYRGDGVYIGRPSLLGNPFRIGEHGTRAEVIAAIVPGYGDRSNFAAMFIGNCNDWRN